MPVYRTTFVFAKHTYCASETYYSGNWTPSRYVENLTRLMNLRNKLLFASFDWVYVRMSEEGPLNEANLKRRKSIRRRPGLYHIFGQGSPTEFPARGNYYISSVNNRPDQVKACGLVEVGFDNGRETRRYFVGVPDAMIQDEPQTFSKSGNPRWWDLFKDFRSNMIDMGWQIKARATTGDYRPQRILRWRHRDTSPSVLGLEMDANTFLRPTGAQFVSIQGVRRKGTDKLSYNGRYLVDQVVLGTGGAPTIVYLAGTEGANAGSIKLPGTMQWVGDAYYPIERFEIVAATTHKRGNGLAGHRGRRLTRISLDP